MKLYAPVVSVLSLLTGVPRGFVVGTVKYGFIAPVLTLARWDMADSVMSRNCGTRRSVNRGKNSTIYHAYTVDVMNSFSALSLLGEDSVLPPHSPSLSFHKVLHSSPKAHNTRPPSPPHTHTGHARFDSSKSLPSSIMSDSVKSPSQSCVNNSHAMPSYKPSAISSKKHRLRTIVFN